MRCTAEAIRRQERIFLENGDGQGDLVIEPMFKTHIDERETCPDVAFIQ